MRTMVAMVVVVGAARCAPNRAPLGAGDQNEEGGGAVGAGSDVSGDRPVGSISPTMPPTPVTGVPACVGAGAIDAHDGVVGAAAFSPDGRVIASFGGGNGGSLSVWNASDHALVWMKSGFTGSGVLPSPQLFSFTADATRLAIPAAGGVRFIDVADGGEIQLMAMAASDRPATVALSPDGQFLAGGCQCSGTTFAGARLWSLAGGSQETGFVAPGHQAYGVAFSPDGSLLAVRAAYPTSDGAPRTAVWRVADRALLWGADVAGETPVRRAFVDFSPDGSQVVAMSESTGAKVRVHGATDGALQAELPAERPASAAWSPDGSLLAVAGGGGMRVWSTADWVPLCDAPGTFQPVAFSPDGSRLMAGAADGKLQFFAAPR
jgi:WD40 repeat protein